MDLLPAINAPGFSIEQFDALNHKAHMHDLRITERVGPVVFVTSASRPGRVHRVTRSECDCLGHASHGRCMHRAFACFMADVVGAFEPKKATTEVVFLHRRGTARKESA